jgi:hypothetical protein
METTIHNPTVEIRKHQRNNGEFFYIVELEEFKGTVKVFVDDVKGFLNSLELAYIVMDRKEKTKEEIKENE